jgi:hypothetical protein
MDKRLILLVTGLVLLSITCMPIRAYGQDQGQAGSSVILDIKPVQVVFNSDINGDGIPEIVDGKSLAILVYIDESYFNNISKQQTVKVKVLYDGVPYYNNTSTVDDIYDQAYVAVKIKPNPFRGSGTKRIEAIVDWDHQIPGLSRYETVKSIEVNSMRTRGLKVLFVPIDGPPGDKSYGQVNQADFDRLFDLSYKFMKSTYPVADQELIFDKYEGRMQGTPSQQRSQGPRKSIAYDSMALARIGDELGYDRVVGVVPRDYFAYHHFYMSKDHKKTPAGLHMGNNNTRGLCRSVFIREDVTGGDVTAHEIGHSFGLNTKKKNQKEEYTSDKYHNKKAHGFNAALMRQAKGPCFMDSTALSPKSHWVCEDTWKELFNTFLAE